MKQLKKLIESLNETNLYLGKDANGKAFLTAQDSDEDAYFINRSCVYASVDDDGKPVPKLDTNGDKIFTWSIGNKLKPRA